MGTHDRTRISPIPTNETLHVDDVTSALDRLTVGVHPINDPSRYIVRLAPATRKPLRRRALIVEPRPPPPPVTPPTSDSQADTEPPQEEVTPTPPPIPDSPKPSYPRVLPIHPKWVIEAPDIVDDFYWNLLSWSSTNILGVALRGAPYLWKADTEEAIHLRHSEDEHAWRISSLEFSQDGDILALGRTSGDIELWDVETQTRLRTITDRSSEISSLCWNKHILTSGGYDATLWNLDVRLARPRVRAFSGHHGTVCGVKWNGNGDLLAGGDSNGLVNIWDSRIDTVLPASADNPRWEKRDHQAAVKALSWCPWRSSVLASGGGASDGTVRFWDVTSGDLIHTLELGESAQVTSIQWSPYQEDFMITLGYTANGMMLYRYPSLERVLDARDAHDGRVLWSALNPSGEIVCTGGADENLKFWRLWDATKTQSEELSDVIPS